MRPDVDVLVVGAGPTGLAAAGELAARGVAVRIVDREPVRGSESRALVVQPRTLELLDRWGGGAVLAARGHRELRVEIFVEGERKVDVDLRDVGDVASPYPFLLFVSQRETEDVLERRLEELGVRVDRPVELVAAEGDADGVTARFADGASCRARWLVGADGAHSVVRKLAGLSFPGAPYEQEFVLADVRVKTADALRFYLSSRGLLVCFPLGGGACRLVASRVGGRGDTSPLDLAAVQAIADELAPRQIAIEGRIWLARFHLHHRGVDHYRRGRLFVAGDAAHIHSPAGGQGMNTGIQDAINLAWKLALVAHGRAPDRLLDSYEEERLPVGRRLLRGTDRLFGFTASPNRFLVRVRNLVAPRLARFILSSPERRRRGFRFVSQLGITYRGSSIVGEAPGIDGGVGPGDRVPDLPLGDGKRLHELLRGTAFHLLLLERPGAVRCADRVVAELGGQDLVVPHVLGAAPEAFYDAFGVDERALYLVRPDGHVAYRAPAIDSAALDAALRKTLL